MDDFVAIQEIVEALHDGLDYRLLAFGGQDGTWPTFSHSRTVQRSLSARHFRSVVTSCAFACVTPMNEGLEVVLTRLETGIWSGGVARLGQGQIVPSWPTSFCP